MITRRTAADGSETWMELRSKRLLRRAMSTTKDRSDGGPDCSSIPKLALACQLSTATIGHLVNENVDADGKPKGRKTCSVETAQRIAAAVGWDLEELFEVHSRPTVSGGGRAKAAAA